MTVCPLLHVPGYRHFFCATILPSLRAVMVPGDRATKLSFHLATCHTVPPATNMPQPCRRTTWCATETPPCHLIPTCRNRVAVLPNAPPCHRVTWFATVPPGEPPRHYSATVPPVEPPRHHSATVPPCAQPRHRRATVPSGRRRTDKTHRLTSVRLLTLHN